MKQKIVFIHSLNNFTGSPNVLSVVINGFLKRGYSAELITSQGDGFLSDIPDLKYRYTCYRWGDNQIITLVRLLLSQLSLFLRILFDSNKNIYYINSIVPFGAILACKLSGKRFVIHVHENMQQPKPIYKLFRLVYRFCNKKSIFVSEYLSHTALNCHDGRVIYNSLLDESFTTASTFLNDARQKNRDVVLMIASQRRFKGIYEFAELAKIMPQYKFELVLSSEKVEVEKFKQEIGEIPNLVIYPLQKNMHPFYQRAKLLLQLSHPEAWVETFGLTILEAMVYGIPAIVPNIGGPVELVESNVNGYTVNPHEIATIKDHISRLMTDKTLYDNFSKEALAKAQKFKETLMIDKIEDYIR